MAEKNDEKPRLLKIRLRSPKVKRKILNKAKELKESEIEHIKKIFITPDLTPAERDENKKLRNELQRRKDAGESGLGIRRGKIVKMKTV